MAHEGHDTTVYHPQDAIAATIKATAVVGAAGLFVSTVQNTLTKQNIGMFAVFTKTGGTFATFAAMGGAYQFTRVAAANLRQKDDTWNAAIGGFFGGSMLGLSFRSAPAVIGYGSGLAIILATFTYSGSLLQYQKIDPDVDVVSHKEHLRKNRRRPIEETINELGEGRGVYAPGYEQRRAERIKERYGIDVPIRAT